MVTPVRTLKQAAVAAGHRRKVTRALTSCGWRWNPPIFLVAQSDGTPKSRMTSFRRWVSLAENLDRSAQRARRSIEASPDPGLN
jgi:hypothetical protein